MIHKKLKVLLLSAAFLGLPSVKAFEWKPTGDLVGADGYAYDAGNVYAEGDRVINTGVLTPPSPDEQPKSRRARNVRSAIFGHTKGLTKKLRAAIRGEVVSTTPGDNIQFEASATDSVLHVHGTLNGDPAGDACSLKVDGDVTIVAHDVDAKVMIESDVTFEPYVDPTGDAMGTGGQFTGTDTAQIYFDVAEGKKIEVEMGSHNVEFRGRTLGGTRKMVGTKSVVSPMEKRSLVTGSLTPIDMFVTFRGRGQVIFHMGDGSALRFMGDIDETAKVDMLTRTNTDFTLDAVSNNAAGTKVMIVMDQTKDDVETKQINKVIFRRQDGQNADATKNSKRNMVLVGANSIITYVSDDATGKLPESDPANAGVLGGYASASFDVSNKGSGRMILFALGAASFGWELTDTNGNPLYVDTDPEFFEMVFKYPFNDGAVVLAGHKVEGFDPEQIRTTMNYSVPAGSQALMRVVDNDAYDAFVAANPTGQYAPTAAERRGLMIFNDNETISKTAADRYWDFLNVDHVPGGVIERSLPHGTGMKHTDHVRSGIASKMSGLCKLKRDVRAGQETPANIFGTAWCYSAGLADAVNLRNTRFGFVVGINGVLDVWHNTFVDFVVGSKNALDLLALNDYQDYKDPSNAASKSRAILMEHNPGALLVDGLDTQLYSNELSLYEAGNPLQPTTNPNPRTAEIRLRGDAALMMRVSASSDLGYVEKFWKLGSPGFVSDATTPKSVGTKKGSWSKTRASVDAAIDPLTLTDLNWDEILVLEDSKYDGYRLHGDAKSRSLGENALEIDGECGVNGMSNKSIVDVRTGKARAYAAEVKDAGKVVAASLAYDYTGKEYDTRPLVRDTKLYSHYNSPRIMLNNELEIANAALVNSDVMKFVGALPTTSEPGVVGGERMKFADAVWTFDGTDRDRYRFPELHLTNAGLELQESLAVSGIRVVATDRDNEPSPKGDNDSRIVFYDHGDNADTLFSGYGRILQFGSYNLTMADGSTNWITESAFANFYKVNKPVASGKVTDSAHVNVRLVNGDQFESSIKPSDYQNHRATHLVLMSVMDKGSANIALGWPTTQADSSETGLPYSNTRYVNLLIEEKMSTNANDLFVVDALKVPTAKLTVDGDYIAFTSFDRNGASPKLPVSSPHASGVVFVNHGGEISVGNTGTEASHGVAVPHQVILDTMVVSRVWNDYNDAGNKRVTQLSGVVDLPHDQVIFGKNGGIQPFGLTSTMLAARSAETSGYVRISLLNENRPVGDRSGGGVVTLNWFNLDEHSNTLTSESRSFAAQTHALRNRKPAKTRATERVTAPITKPANLLYVGSGDDIQQLRVAGATKSNPFMLEVSGDEKTNRFGNVREFVSVPAVELVTDHLVGEGAHAVIFGEFGGRFGLGSTDLNADSVNAWNRLGREAVQIAVQGDCTVDVNSDVVVVDNLPLVATDNFGATGVQRITFTSELEREIRVPAGIELDLSSFGHGANRQEIAFGGNVKLVLEPGAIIRFPHHEKGGVVLYFTDNAQLIFERGIDLVNQIAYKSSADADMDRTKIMGHGQIWGNKDASIQILDGALVGVQSDALTPLTDVTVSLNRNAAFNLGTPTIAGGSFEVGNPVAVSGGEVSFRMRAAHADCVINIDRRGFLGLGAGIVNKIGSMNGSATAATNPVISGGVALQTGNGAPQFSPAADAWLVQPLNNVKNIVLELSAGTLEHELIMDGSNNDASLIAVGPAQDFTLSVNGAASTSVLGGGNVMLVRASGESTVNLWDYASAFPAGEQYGILASGPQLVQRRLDVDGNVPFSAGSTYTASTAAAFFAILTAQNYNDESTKYVAVGEGGGNVVRAAFTNLDAAGTKYLPTQRIIVRSDIQTINGGRLADALDVGAAAGIESNDLGPTSFGVLAGRQ